MHGRIVARAALYSSFPLQYYCIGNSDAHAWSMSARLHPRPLRDGTAHGGPLLVRAIGVDRAYCVYVCISHIDTANRRCRLMFCASLEDTEQWCGATTGDRPRFDFAVLLEPTSSVAYI